MASDLPNVDPTTFRIPDPGALLRMPAVEHRPRILLLYTLKSDDRSWPGRA
jgi:hypothetical protein